MTQYGVNTDDPNGIYKELSSNKFDDVFFQDPLSDVTRKVKRNLLIASISCLFIFKVEIKSFLGFYIPKEEPIDNDIVKGISCLFVIYYSLLYLGNFFVDIIAWKFQRERLIVNSYTKLVTYIARTLDEAPKHFNASLEFMPYSGSSSPDENFQQCKDYVLKVIDNHKENHEIVKPVIDHWKSNIDKSFYLYIRLILRFVILIVFELIIPFLLAFSAIYLTYEFIGNISEHLTTFFTPPSNTG
ncbi:hypothetical protein [Photobacterium lipolyticum]|uniref:Uncharacterized protein n=1 Tax=Photobacterium lipolyticum TaxID=266810 RepID=A0A2T3N2J4_9GAMM|nr:hypothetical protein [Photobacterium lipolyticum]PSW06589.1 hypothetical protein C9I89_03365 [Photobacterium lipolyticum]